MENEKSLVELAQKAGFENMHGMVGRTTKLIGSIMSDDYEILYFKLNNDMKFGPEDPVTKSSPVYDLGTVEVFGIINPHDYETCALYRLKRADLVEWIEKGGVNLGNKTPLHTSQTAIDVLLSYIIQLETANKT